MHGNILGRTEGGYYDFIQLNFAIEHRLIEKKLTLLFEPFIAYINRPERGMDVGSSLALRYWVTADDFQGLYLTLGTGVAYTTVDFKEQGVQGMFILQCGIGYKWKRFFVEDRFRHYSNAGLSRPNRSLHATMINIGVSF